MPRQASVIKKLTVAALLSAVGCTSQLTQLSSLSHPRKKPSTAVATAKKVKKTHKTEKDAEIVQVSYEERPSPGKEKQKAPVAKPLASEEGPSLGNEEEQGPALGTPAREEGPSPGHKEEGPILEPLTSEQTPQLHKVPGSPAVKTPSNATSKKAAPKAAVVAAGFVEPLPMPTPVKHPTARSGEGGPELGEQLPLPTPAKLHLELPGVEQLAMPREAFDVPTGELLLEEAIHLTLGANPDLRSAAERTHYAAEVLARARADFFPVLAFNENYQVSNNPLNKFSYLLSQGIKDPNTLFSPPDVLDNFQSQLRLQQELYSGGSRAARTRSAEAESDAAHHSLAALQNRIVFQVAEAYYRLFQARELVKVREESVKQVEEQLKSVEARFKAQSAVRSDVLRVEVRLASVREALISAKNQLSLAWAVLENVTGVPLAGRVLPEHLPPAPWSGHLDGMLASAQGEVLGEGSSPLLNAVAEAISRRPEIGEVSSKREAAEQRVLAAQSGKKPKLGFVSDYDLNTGDFHSKTSQQSFTVGLNLSLNIFDGGRTKSMVRQAEAAVREVDAQQTRVRLDITLDVRRAFLQMKDASERLNVAETSVKNAEEILKDVNSRYRNQNATLTDQLDAQVALTDARVRTTNAAAEVEVARAALERAIGRLNEELGGPEAQGAVVHEVPAAHYAEPTTKCPVAEKIVVPPPVVEKEDE